MDRYHELLRKHWGHAAFRPLQEEIIRSVCDGHDTLGLMPTGGGKSITFQVSALAMEGLCLVITPLIALMKDQVDRLRKVGLTATLLHASVRRKEQCKRLERCVAGKEKFLYVSPERLRSPLFRAYLAQMRLCLIVVDEAHCISQWGYDFRPAYLRIAEIRPEFPQTPILALTATATPQVADDIQSKLCFRQKRLLQQSFARPNLAYRVSHAEDKRKETIRLLRLNPGSAIIYTRSRLRAEHFAERLQREGFTADYFHAGLPWFDKEERQERWSRGDCPIMVATNAFGMGIDKADVRLVIHLDAPTSLEEYFQEAGRAGRDGLPAQAVVFFSEQDEARMEVHLANRYPEGTKLTKTEQARKKQLTEQVAQTLRFMKAHRGCRSQRLLAYFGEQLPHPCGQCDLCTKETEQLTDAEFEQIRQALDAQLSATPQPVYPLVDRLPFEPIKCLTVVRYLLNEEPHYQLREGWLLLKEETY